MNVSRILAPNPGWLTGAGTNTYVITSGEECAVIDPGPNVGEHVAAIVAACTPARPVAVLVTHGHPDHYPAAPAVAALLSVPVLGPIAVGGFKPDRVLADGEVVECGSVGIEAVATPGHCADHFCYRAGNHVFTGDLVLGGTSVVVEDVSAYLDSLGRLRRLEPACLWPGHGERIDDPGSEIDGRIEHRLRRERQVIDAIAAGAGTVPEIVALVYHDVPEALHPVAEISVVAHLRRLRAETGVELSLGAAESGAPETTREETAG
jgi:glyoxylase-like metal-dependent hydrolase (beta-lactamase superfamily II)